METWNGTGTSLAEARDKVIRDVTQAEVKFIRLWFTDVVGRLKSFAITRDELESALDHGMGFDGSSVTGFNAIEESDMIAMPDPATFRMLPRQSGERAVARMFCDIRTPDGEPYEADSRHVLRNALDRMRSMGFDSFKIGPELEFFLFRLDEAGRPHTLDAGGYFEDTTADAAVVLRKDIVLALEDMGIPVEYLHHEVGPSQHEIDVRYADALQMADHCMTYRSIVKEVAQRHGVYATFMPKPLFGENGSGMHTHQSLFIGDTNAFHDPDDRAYLSDVAKSFIAGQLRHAREISLLFAQWVNSYKRLVPGYEAPVYIGWARINRSALIRIPQISAGQTNSTRIELRCPDPSSNPYLAFAVMLAAGLDGIDRDLTPPEPVEENLYHFDAAKLESRHIRQLPGTLREALDELCADSVIGEALGEHVFERFIEAKTEEWDDYRKQVSGWEVERYLEAF
jgi:glutamine synthetase